MEIGIAKLSLVVLCLCNFIFAYEEENPIENICWSARNPNNCFQLFRGDSRKPVPELAKKAITEAGISAVNTKTLLTILTMETSDPRLKGKYGACSKNFIELMKNLDGAAQSILKFKEMGDYTFYALLYVDDCVQIFGGAPVITPPQLNDMFQEILNLCGIILSISRL